MISAEEVGKESSGSDSVQQENQYSFAGMFPSTEPVGESAEEEVTEESSEVVQVSSPGPSCSVIVQMPEKSPSKASKEFLRVFPGIHLDKDELHIDDAERLQVELENLLTLLSSRVRVVRKELGDVKNGQDQNGANGVETSSTNGNSDSTSTGYQSEEDSCEVFYTENPRRKVGIIVNNQSNNGSPPKVILVLAPAPDSTTSSSASSVNGEEPTSASCQPSTSGQPSIASVYSPSSFAVGPPASKKLPRRISSTSNATSTSTSSRPMSPNLMHLENPEQAPQRDDDESSGEVPYVSLSSLERSPSVSPSKRGKGWSRKSDKPGRGKNRYYPKGKGGVGGYRSISPNHFWDMVDDYCRELTYKDVEFLEEMLDEHKPLPEEVFSIPALGPHFKGEKSPVPQKTPQKRMETRSHDGWGPVTQRLVSALVDKQCEAYTELKTRFLNGEYTEQHLTVCSNIADEIYKVKLNATGVTGLDDSGSPKKSIPLDTYVKKVLLNEEDEEEDAMSLEDDDDSDEILNEIHLTQCKLKHIQESNRMKLLQLHELAEREAEKNSAKQELAKADKTLIDAYRVVSNARSKKKPLTKREREVAIRALESRRTAMEQLKSYQYAKSSGSEKTCNGLTRVDDEPSTSAASIVQD